MEYHFCITQYNASNCTGVSAQKSHRYSVSVMTPFKPHKHPHNVSPCSKWAPEPRPQEFDYISNEVHVQGPWSYWRHANPWPIVQRGPINLIDEMLCICLTICLFIMPAVSTPITILHLPNVESGRRPIMEIFKFYSGLFVLVHVRISE